MNKERPFPPIKSAGIREWLSKSAEHGLIEMHKAAQLIDENEQTGAQLQERGLPAFAVYGVKATIEEFIPIVSEEARTHEKFLVRCAPRELNRRDLKIQRTLNVSWEEAVDFVKKLPTGSEQYTVELREYWDPDYGGTVIANGKGKVAVEMIAGRHADIDRATAAELMHGEIDTIKGDIHFQYTGSPTPAAQEVMMNAIRHFQPTLTRAKLDQLKIYAEFVYKAGKGYRFIDISDQDFWTDI